MEVERRYVHPSELLKMRLSLRASDWAEGQRRVLTHDVAGAAYMDGNGVAFIADPSAGRVDI